MTSEATRSAQALRVIGRCRQPMLGFALDGTIVLWNAAAETLLGIPACAALGRPCYALLQGCDRAGQAVCSRGCLVLQQARAGDALAPFALSTHHADGHVLPLVVSSVVVTDAEARPAGIVHLLHSAAPAEALLALADLTGREREVCTLLVDGLGTRVIAAQLGISYATARNHLQHILAKLQVHSRAQAVVRLREAAQHPGPSPPGRAD
jgi:DNA-binding CsgD family transcriptional regulator